MHLTGGIVPVRKHLSWLVILSPRGDWLSPPASNTAVGQTPAQGGIVKIDELALEEASAKLLRLRLTDVGGRKERPSETVKSVLKRGLGGMYDDQVVMYILRHGLQYYQSAQQSVQPTVATVAPPEVESDDRNSG